MVCDFAKQGIGVIFISSELTEVLNVSDNIIVMHNGHITARLQDRKQRKSVFLNSLCMIKGGSHGNSI